MHAKCICPTSKGLLASRTDGDDKAAGNDFLNYAFAALSEFSPLIASDVSGAK